MCLLPSIAVGWHCCALLEGYGGSAPPENARSRLLLRRFKAMSGYIWSCSGRRWMDTTWICSASVRFLGPLKSTPFPVFPGLSTQAWLAALTLPTIARSILMTWPWTPCLAAEQRLTTSQPCLMLGQASKFTLVGMPQANLARTRRRSGSLHASIRGRAWQVL